MSGIVLMAVAIVGALLLAAFGLKLKPSAFTALAAIAVLCGMAACANACGTAALVGGCSQQLVAAPVNYAPIVAPLAVYQPPVVQQFVQPQPVYSQPVQQFSAGYSYSQQVVQPVQQLQVQQFRHVQPVVAAVKVKPVRFPNLPRNSVKAAVVAPDVAPVVAY